MKRNMLPLALLRVLLHVLQGALLVTILSSTALANAGEQENVAALFEQANIFSTQGQFQQAIVQYSDIIDKQGLSASLLYNLANTYAAAGEVGRAVLNYERAQQLNPGDADIQGNLEQVRKDAGLYRADQPLERRVAGLLGADQWLLLAGSALLCCGMTALLITLGVGKRGKGKSLHWLATSSLLVFLLTLPLAFLRYQDWNIGVVVAEDTHLLISPFVDAKFAGDIKAGRLVRPEKEHGEYVLVATETGKSGWLAKDSFSLITEPVKE